MKIEKLNENKIKVTFNIDDLAEKNIDLYSFMHNTPETQDVFWDILNEAEKECGFNVDNSMIYVEATTSGGGNFSLIVTKTNEKPSLLSSINPTYNKKSFKLKRKIASINTIQNIYQFDSFDDVCEYAQTINLKRNNNNILYSLANKYYLKLFAIPSNNILEYAVICKSPELLEARIMEYGKVIIEKNALQTISKYFCKKNKASK